MRSHLAYVAIAMLGPLVLACQQQDVTLSDNDVAAIREVYRTMVQTTLAGDLDSYLSIFTEDVVFMPPNQSSSEGRLALREWTKPIDAYTSHVVTPVEIEGRGDIAFARLTYAVSVRLTDGTLVTDEGKGVNILHRQADGSWLISRMIWNSALPPTQ